MNKGLNSAIPEIQNKILPKNDRLPIRFNLPLNDFSRLGLPQPNLPRTLPKIRGPAC